MKKGEVAAAEGARSVRMICSRVTYADNGCGGIQSDV